MNEDIRRLIEDLRRGNYEDPAEKIGLLAAALREQNADASLLLSLLKAPQIPVRLAAIEASFGRSDPSLMEAWTDLVKDRDTRVRAKVAEALATASDNVTIQSLQSLTGDSEYEVRVAAINASAGKPEFLEIHRLRLRSDLAWGVRYAAAKALGQHNNPAVFTDLFVATANDTDRDVKECCADFIEKRLDEAPSLTEKNLPGDISLLLKAAHELEGYDSRFPKLLRWIRSRTANAVDLAGLASFGADLTATIPTGKLPRAHEVGEQCRKLVDLIHREPWRSLVLLGETGVGKSALVNELAHQLAAPENGGWRILRVSPTEFMAGTKYLGEWETRVRDLVNAVRKPRRVIVYVPNFGELAAMGRWSKSDANVATALAPHIEEGSIIVLGECTPDEFERGLGSTPSLQRLFDKVLLVEPTRECTRAILSAIRDEASASISDEVLDRLQEISSYFLSHQCRPGNAAGLLRLVLAGHQANETPITYRDVLGVLSKSTGLPSDLVNDQIPLHAQELLNFFEQRIIGQPEAVEAVVDLITLIKAGLTDPNKPFGVFLFVGPTGVGKTELARALAEYIFGDARRLLRFDMSEFSSPEAFRRLIGGQGESGLLTDAVRQQPFSVVLLDEIEKSHGNIFDLCLQVFDAGRLTDGRGQLVDFRRTIIILTSNIGAEAPSRPLGFGSGSSTPSPEADKERIWRELSRFFRPEFLNRLDRIVNFRALSLSVAERIAQREVELVLQRSGIARRKIAVNVDPSALTLLVREGYSPHFGARPLKRTVERLLLLPLARTIASGRRLESGIVSLRAAGNKIEVLIPQVPATTTPAKNKPARPTGWQRNLQTLIADFNALQPRLQPLMDRKSSLLAHTHDEGFYQNELLRAATFDEIHKLEQYLGLVEALREALESLQARREGEPLRTGDEAVWVERAASLAAELNYIRHVAQCQNARDLGDALVVLRCVEHKGTAPSGVEQLARMYLAFAERRRLTPEVIAERFDTGHDLAFVQITGLGAFGLLKNESGLHRLQHRSRPVGPRNNRHKPEETRETVRLEVFPGGLEPDKRFLAGITSKITDLRPPRSRLLDLASLAVSAFHQPSLRSLEIWLAGSRTEAIPKAARLLLAQISAPEVETADPGLIRQYDLGVGSRIKDFRSGRTTVRIAQVLKGHLELLSPLDPAA